MTSKKSDGGPAYPIWTPDMKLGDHAGPGMSLRDWFAGQALVGLLASRRISVLSSQFAQSAYDCADAMLKAREGQS